MAKNKHMNFDDRSTIAVLLKEKKNFATIGKAIGKDPTTIQANYTPCTSMTEYSHPPKDILSMK